jgi:isoquinoline 1-oxidoreductase beta subunit
MTLAYLTNAVSRTGLSRRGFLQAGAAAGGGLMLSLRLPLAGGPAQAGEDRAFVPNAFVRIGYDGSIVLTMPYVEMGQGTYTSVSMLIAEELEVDLGQVRVEHAPPDPKRYGNPLLGGIQATGNSNAMRAAWQPLRQAGAVARTMLAAAAAERWNVDPAACRVQRGAVVHAPTERNLGYGELAADAAHMPVPDKVALKPPEQFRLIGTPAKRVDSPSKVNGRQSTASMRVRPASRSRRWRSRPCSAAASRASTTPRRRRSKACARSCGSTTPSRWWPTTWAPPRKGWQR